MKTKKRLWLIVSMLVLVFALCGCDEEIKAPFEYNETAIAVDAMGLFQQYSQVSKDAESYYLTDGSDFEKTAIKGIQQARDNDEVGKFQDYSDIINGYADPTSVDPEYPVIENGSDYVMVTFLNKAQNRDVEITVKFVENANYYIEFEKYIVSVENQIMSDLGVTLQEYIDMYGQQIGIPSVEAYYGEIKQMMMQEGVYPYTPVEMVVSPVYSSKEMLSQAAVNTLTGMGVVFCVLVFISFIISLLKFLPALLAKKPKVPEADKPAAAEDMPKKTVKIKQAAPPAESASENLMDNKELVAVITAAVYAAAGAGGATGVPGAVSKDKLVVRSIKRAKK